MSVRRFVRFNRYLMVANVTVLAAAVAFLFFGGRSKGTIEGNRLILRGQSGHPAIIMQGDNDSTLLTLNDREGNIRLQLQGGEFPAMIMKNENREIVGTFFPLKDGGSGMGFGDDEGNMALFMRGGSTPAVNLYHKSSQPNIAMGIANELPHFVLFPIEGQEGMLIHGNAPTSLFFIDEEGNIPVSLSRHGLYQESKEQMSATEPALSSCEELKKTLQAIDYTR